MSSSYFAFALFQQSTLAPLAANIFSPQELLGPLWEESPLVRAVRFGRTLVTLRLLGPFELTHERDELARVELSVRLR